MWLFRITQLLLLLNVLSEFGYAYKVPLPSSEPAERDAVAPLPIRGGSARPTGNQESRLKQQESTRTLNQHFGEAIIQSMNLKEKPEPGQSREMYALIYQVVYGDCNTKSPDHSNSEVKQLWDAWNHKKGTSRDQAKQDFINIVQDLVSSLGLKQ